ncbi:MAG: hypothetical protein K2I10_09505 [Lachnospiraceae bacterium]|nr:hypothetical protein [Lachnospiraceae bacterium]
MKTGKFHKIKYDMRDKRNAFMLAIVLSLLTVISFMAYFLPSDGFSAEFVCFITLSIISSPVVCLAGGAYYLEICTYLNRLKKHGYETPKNKKDFSGKLEYLSKAEQSPCISGKSGESISLAVACLLCSIGVALEAAYYLFDNRFNWDIMGAELIFMEGMILVMAVLWLLGAFAYWRQRIQEYYRDDVEMDENRKARRQIVDGVITILVMLLITIVMVSCIHSITDYIQKIRLNP